MFDTEPQIPQDSKDVLNQVLRSIRKELKEKLGLITASGLMIWGCKKLAIPLSIKTAFSYKEREFKFDVIIKPTKALDTLALSQTKDGLSIVYQLYNNIVKDVLRKAKLDEVTPGKFFLKETTKVYEKIGLSVMRGYKMTLAALKEKNLLLQIDVCSKVFRSYNMLE